MGGAGPPDRAAKPRRLGTNGARNRRTVVVIVLVKAAELLFRGVNRVRRALYRAGVLAALRLHRDVDFVIESGDATLRREGPSALRDADLVLRRNLRLQIPEGLEGKRLFAFAGLAGNQQFFDSLREAGFELAGTRGFRDHHRYTPADI